MTGIDYDAAALAVRERTLWVAIAQVAISIAQTGIVHCGVRAMIRAADRRGRDAEPHKRRNPVGHMFRRLNELRRIAATVIFPSYFPGMNPGAGSNSHFGP